jgi:putative transposase
MTDDLVIKALRKAVDKGLIPRGAIIHTDRGGQFISKEFRRLLKAFGLLQSMSRKGNCL